MITTNIIRISTITITILKINMITIIIIAINNIMINIIIITRASPSDCLASYPGHSLEESYPSAETQSMYSTAPANLEVNHKEYYGKKINLNMSYSTRVS